VLGGQPGHRVEDLVQTAAAVLGLVHREVGVSQQGLRDVLAGAGKGDADAGDPDPVVGEGEWRGHHCDDALGHGLGVRAVAADPRTAPRTRRHRLEGPLTGGLLPGLDRARSP